MIVSDRCDVDRDVILRDDFLRGDLHSTIIFPAQFMTTVQEAIALLSKDNI
jgi:hypothetical protein